MKIDNASERIINNDIGIIPHDTLPGIVGILSTQNAMRINVIKKRSSNKGFIVLIPSPLFLNDLVANISTKTQQLMDQFWPGPLTLIFDKKDMVPSIICGSKSTIAIRFPDDDFLNHVLNTVRQPLISTSANISGDTAISKELMAAVDFVYPNKSTFLDSKNQIHHQNVASSIVDARQSPPIILREGAILAKDVL